MSFVVSCSPACAAPVVQSLPVAAPCFSPCADTPALPVPEVDCEWIRGCDDVSGDGSLVAPYLIKICTDTLTGIASAPTTHALDGSAYAPANPIACPGAKDLEALRACYRSIADASIHYFRIDLIDPVAQTVVASIWQDESGATVATPAGVEPCSENADRPYTPRTSGMIAGATAFAIPAPAAPARLRSFTLMVRSGSVTLTNGPDAGVSFPPGSYSWAAPVAAPGAERGFLSFLPAFLGVAGGAYMVDWTEG